MRVLNPQQFGLVILTNNDIFWLCVFHVHLGIDDLHDHVSSGPYTVMISLTPPCVTLSLRTQT